MYEQAGDAALSGELMAAMAVYWVFALVWTLIIIVAQWKIFTKAGKPGWASIIPIYNVIVLLEMVGRPVWWIVLFFIPFVNVVIMFMVYNDLSKSFGKGVGFTLGLIFLSAIFMLILAFGSARYVGPGGVATALPQQYAPVPTSPGPPAPPAM